MATLNVTKQNRKEEIFGLRKVLIAYVACDSFHCFNVLKHKTLP